MTLDAQNRFSAIHLYLQNNGTDYSGSFVFFLLLTKIHNHIIRQQVILLTENLPIY
jgi:hypothetical protein